MPITINDMGKQTWKAALCSLAQLQTGVLKAAGSSCDKW